MSTKNNSKSKPGPTAEHIVMKALQAGVGAHDVLTALSNGLALAVKGNEEEPETAYMLSKVEALRTGALVFDSTPEAAPVRRDLQGAIVDAEDMVFGEPAARLLTTAINLHLARACGDDMAQFWPEICASALEVAQVAGPAFTEWLGSEFGRASEVEVTPEQVAIVVAEIDAIWSCSDFGDRERNLPFLGLGVVASREGRAATGRGSRWALIDALERFVADLATRGGQDVSEATGWISRLRSGELDVLDPESYETAVHAGEKLQHADEPTLACMGHVLWCASYVGGSARNFELGIASATSSMVMLLAEHPEAGDPRDFIAMLRGHGVSPRAPRVARKAARHVA